jgi:hypothetical protein
MQMAEQNREPGAGPRAAALHRSDGHIQKLRDLRDGPALHVNEDDRGP